MSQDELLKYIQKMSGILQSELKKVYLRDGNHNFGREMRQLRIKDLVRLEVCKKTYRVYPKTEDV